MIKQLKQDGSRVIPDYRRAPQMRPAIIGVFIALFVRSDFSRADVVVPMPGQVMLINSDRMLVQLTPGNAIGIFDVHSDRLVRRFLAHTAITSMTASPDGTLVLFGCDDGEVLAHTTDTGTQIWHIKGRGRGRDFVHSIRFASKGKYCLVVLDSGETLIVESANGGIRSRIRLPASVDDCIVDGALTASGEKAFLISSKGHLYGFEVGGTTVRDLGVNGAAPVEVSSDDNYVAIRSSNAGDEERLRMLSIRTRALRDVGYFGSIGRIRAASDGTYLVTAEPRTGVTTGSQVNPDGGLVRELWRVTGADVNSSVDFLPRVMIGVCADERGIITVIDLRAMKVRHKLEPSTKR